MDARASCYPRQIRILLAIIFPTCSPFNPKGLWKKFREDLSEDIFHRVHTVSNGNSIEFSDNIFNQALIEIKDICLTINSKEFLQLGMISPQRSAFEHCVRDLVRQQQYIANDLRAVAVTNEQHLLAEQKLTHDTITIALSNGRGGLVFLDAPSGIEKPFLISFYWLTFDLKTELLWLLLHQFLRLHY
ncbi:uncharacterized protein LOC129965598 [Argiope bruennichi]|uniref:uncharacterized protein LOC129965598 n=1 Tax=Argiope bruennichi TaxID=94029 RepID=UPI0024949EA4|nr:uncharacterized protein LOC129965598 [Argiope bruennichi]